MHTAPPEKRWTLEEFHALPEDDGNKYEFAYGELWVTPGPTESHNDIVANLTHILVPYVDAQQLGRVYHPRTTFRVGREFEVEPDLMVRPSPAYPRSASDRPPHPILVVEVVSPSSRRRDYGKKKDLYTDQEIPEYWIVDGDKRVFSVVRPGRDPEIVSDRLTWSPSGAREPLTFDLTDVFG